MQEGAEQTPKEREAAAAISATVAAASERQQRRAIPVQGEFFMPGDEAGAGAEATLNSQVLLPQQSVVFVLPNGVSLSASASAWARIKRVEEAPASRATIQHDLMAPGC